MADQKLPKAIQAQVEQAEAIEKQLQEAASQGNTEQPQTPQEPAPQPAPVVEEPAPANPSDEDAGFKKKYEVLSGKYSKEVPRLHAEVQRLQEQLAALAEEQAKLKTPAEPVKPKEALVTSKDEETFGSDLIDVARRVAKDEIAAVLDRISVIERIVASVAKIPEKVQQIESRQVQSAEEKFWSDVATAVPDWSEIDTNPSWIEFLDNKAPFAVKTYRVLALEAIQAGEVEPIVELVNLWKESTGITKEAQKKSEIQQELQSQTQPGKQKASNPAPVEKRVWTGDEYSAAFDPRLIRTMAQADIDKLQAEAELAYEEGRVRW